MFLAVCAPAQDLSALQWRGIGPAATGGRIADLAVYQTPGEADVLFVATATGGIFKSENAGISFRPVFDQAGGMLSIGAVAVAPSNHRIVWAGGGEADNRQSSSWGDGVYKSTDGGATWARMGLEDTRHIGRIAIHPADPNTVWVAACGHLWGSNAERGVYKTTDGGQTWRKVLYQDEHTGATDLAIDPSNPEVVYAAMYQRQRKGWGFNGGGPGSGIYRTRNGGATWTELLTGLPAGDKGRIGLAVSEQDPRILYATVEAEGGGVFRSRDGGESWEQRTGLNPRPSYYSRVYIDPKDDNRVYLMGSNRGLFISEDGAASFRDVFSNVHGEDHALWIDPANTSHLIAGGDGGVSISYDRGQSWLFRVNLPIGQFYKISANRQDPFLVCGGLQDNGSWCTPSATNVSYGLSFKDAFNVGGGDGMHAVFDGDDRTLLVSSQNGVTARLDLNSMERQLIGPVTPPDHPRAGRPGYRWYWTTPLVVSHFNPNTLYTGANVVFRSDDRGVTWKAISPDLTGRVDRDNLEMMGAPVPPRALSRHDGQANFSALTEIAESPLDRNLLYTGADDGTIQMTRDGGRHWSAVTIPGLPPMLNISGIAASRHAAGRVYVAVDGHFNDDYRPYIYVSEDYGRTWRAITAGLPEASVHAVREHPSNPNLLVAGLEMGAWATFDRGAHWVSLNTNLPPVPVYDLLFQERSHSLVLGTHGRGIWVLDHIQALEEMTTEVLSGGGHLFTISPAHHQVVYNGQYWFGAGEFFAPNPPRGAVLTYYLPRPAPPAVRITLADAAGKVIHTMRGPGNAGLNRTCWELRMDPAVPPPGEPPYGNCGAASGRGAGPLVEPGRYRVTVQGAGEILSGELTVDPDPRFPISESERRKRFTAVMSAYTLQQRLVSARDTARELMGRAPGPDVNAAQSQIARALAEAAAVQTAIDGYAGMPTAAQLRQLDWAWEDGSAAVAALNQSIERHKTADLKPVTWQSR